VIVASDVEVALSLDGRPLRDSKVTVARPTVGMLRTNVDDSTSTNTTLDG
jgi:hypothetical protein